MTPACSSALFIPAPHGLQLAVFDFDDGYSLRRLLGWMLTPEDHTPGNGAPVYLDGSHARQLDPYAIGALVEPDEDFDLTAWGNERADEADRRASRRPRQRSVPGSGRKAGSDKLSAPAPARSRTKPRANWWPKVKA